MLLAGALVAAGCGSSTVESPSAAGQPSAAPSTAPASGAAATPAQAGDPVFGAMVADAVARAGQPVADADFDIEREQLLTDMGLPDALGADAGQVLALIGQAEADVRDHTIPAGLGRDQGRVTARLVTFGSFPAPYAEFRAFLTGGVQAIGAAGPNTYHEDVGTYRRPSPRRDDGRRPRSTRSRTRRSRAPTSRSSSTPTSTRTSSRHATGSTVMTETRRATIAGEIDACPSAAGLVPGSSS